MGSLAFAYVLFPMFIFVLIIARSITPCCPRVKVKADEILNRAFFNSILRFVEETYLVTTTCSFVNIRFIWLGYSDSLNTKLSLTALIIIIGQPLLLASIFFFVKIRTIMSYSFKKRLGVIYENLETRTVDKHGDLSHVKNRLKWPIYEAFEKLVLVYVLVFSIDRPYAQLIVINFLSVFYIIVVGNLRPYKTPSANKWKLFGEIFVFLIFYHLLSLSDFVQDAETRSTIGWSMICITSFSLVSDLVRLGFLNAK